MAAVYREFATMDLRKFRIDRGFSQADLSRRSGVDPSIISRLENRRRHRANYETTIRLARALAIRPEVLEPVSPR